MWKVVAVGGIIFVLICTIKYSFFSRDLKDVEEDKQVRGPSTVNNALFVGSTADLAKMLKDGLKEEPK